VPPAREAALRDVAAQAGIPVTRIGQFRAGPPVAVVLASDGSEMAIESGGWSHFR
jgi:thiamine monophosphate kinase